MNLRQNDLFDSLHKKSEFLNWKKIFENLKT